MKYIKSRNFIYDVFAIVGLSLFSFFLVSFYWNASFINTTYPDWMVHAFRVKLLQQFGFTSWTHVWSNGISVWKAYQFVPHFVALFVVSLFHVSITRAMVLVTIGLFILFRLFTYGALRLLKVNPIASLAATVLTFDIAQFWSGVSDYSLLFGFALFPVIIYLWIKHTEDKLTFLYPFIAGFCIYIHPLLGFAAMSLWFVGILLSNKKIFSPTNLMQLGIMLLSSLLFWFPVLIKGSYEYTNLDLASRYFLNLVLSSYQFYGLSFYLFAFLCISIAYIVFAQITYKWVKALLLFTVAYLALIFVGITIDLPQVIDQFQYTRGMTFVGVAIAFLAAPMFEKLFESKSILFKGVLLFFFAFIVSESIWFASNFSSDPTKNFNEPVSYFLQTNPKIDLSKGRIWSPRIDLTSYYPSTKIRLPYSYMGHLESNQAAARINELLLYQPYIEDIPRANVDRIDDYFQLTGVKYVFLDAGSPLSKVFSDPAKSDYEKILTVNFPDNIYYVYQTPWQPRDAVLVDTAFEDSLTHFPFNLNFSSVTDQNKLDQYVNQFVTMLYDPKNTPLTITYPTQESINVVVPNNRVSNLIYIDESYDTGWTATFNNKKQTIQATGPNFMLVKLDDSSQEGTLVLTHSWPVYFRVGIAALILTPLSILLYTSRNYIKKYLSKLKKREK